MSRKTCPECGEAARVIDSREHPTHCRRRYVCPQGHRYTTVEIIAPTKQGRRRYVCPQGHRYTTVEIIAPTKQGRDSYEMINAGLHMGEIIDDIGRRLRDVAKDIGKLGQKP